MVPDLLAALALVLIIEGLLPGLNPQLWRNLFKQLAHMEDRVIRLVGIGSMIAGAVLFNLIR